MYHVKQISFILLSQQSWVTPTFVNILLLMLLWILHRRDSTKESIALTGVQALIDSSFYLGTDTENFFLGTNNLIVCLAMIFQLHEDQRRTTSNQRVGCKGTTLHLLETQALTSHQLLLKASTNSLLSKTVSMYATIIVQPWRWNWNSNGPCVTVSDESILGSIIYQQYPWHNLSDKL